MKRMPSMLPDISTTKTTDLPEPLEQKNPKPLSPAISPSAPPPPIPPSPDREPTATDMFKPAANGAAINKSSVFGPAAGEPLLLRNSARLISGVRGSGTG